MSTYVPPEMRMWRIGENNGRHIYALLSNDPRRPSESDPLLGVMESSAVADDVVSTHNGALARYGRRYNHVLASAAQKEAAQINEVYFQVSAGERQQLIEVCEWMNKGPFRPMAVIQKFLGVLRD